MLEKDEVLEKLRDPKNIYSLHRTTNLIPGFEIP